MRLTHLDKICLRELVEPAALVESVRPASEADDAVFRRARVIVDTYDGMRESCDLLGPSRGRTLDATQVRDLAALLSDATVPRRDAEEITVFKAMGSAIADLAVAPFFLRRHNETPTTATGAIR